MDFLKNKYARILTLALIAQACLFYGLSRGESVPYSRPLSEFPVQLGNWSLLQEGVVDKDTNEVLRADDILTRVYHEASTGQTASLFVAFFKTQRTGQTPHSPKNCLPGNGWVPAEYGIIPISVPGRAQPILVNRYVVSNGEQTSLVFYWYQTNRRVVASEYAAKIYSVLDAVRYNRSDTSLVRVIVPAEKGGEAATGTAIRFVQAFFGPLRSNLPS